MSGTTTTSTALGGIGIPSLSASNMSGISALTQGVNGGMNGLGSTSNPQGIDALSQAYTGIQQYAGLSGLITQGKGSFLHFLLSFCRCVPVSVRTSACPLVRSFCLSPSRPVNSPIVKKQPEPLFFCSIEDEYIDFNICLSPAPNC